MTLHEALTKELRIPCPRCQGTGSVTHISTSGLKVTWCDLCKSSGALPLSIEELTEMVEVLRTHCDYVKKNAQIFV